MYIYITPKSYYLIMFNNKNFNVSWITTFNDLHMFINFIFKKFDRFHDKCTPYNLPSNHQWGLVQLPSKLSGQHLVLSTPDRNAKIADIYCPSLFVEWYAQNVLEQHKFTNVNCFTLLDKSCHFSNTRRQKWLGFNWKI